MQRATERTIEDWPEASKMPPLAFILERTALHPDIEAQSRKLLERDDKPQNWEQLGARNGVSKTEIAQWLEEGKQKQRTSIAELTQDPRCNWRQHGRAFPHTITCSSKHGNLAKRVENA